MINLDCGATITSYENGAIRVKIQDKRLGVICWMTTASEVVKRIYLFFSSSALHHFYEYFTW